jgi:hypothetical protein
MKHIALVCLWMQKQGKPNVGVEGEVKGKAIPVTGREGP